MSSPASRAKWIPLRSKRQTAAANTVLVLLAHEQHHLAILAGGFALNHVQSWSYVKLSLDEAKYILSLL